MNCHNKKMKIYRQIKEKKSKEDNDKYISLLPTITL